MLWARPHGMHMVKKRPGVSRPRRYEPFLRGSAGVFEFCMTFCWSTVDARVRPGTTVYRVQTSYGLSRLFLACFGGVTGQR
jgi:hypothetical protein